MIDRSTSRTMDEVPEADLAEQSIPAYPDDTAFLDDGTYSDELSAAVDRDASSANPADVIEQSIAVPLGDENDPTA